MRAALHKLAALIVLGLVLSACGLVSSAQPTAAPTSFGTIVGYTETTTGNHIVDINLFDKPAGAPPPYRSIGYAHEGQRVGVLEQRDDGTIRVRTPDGIEGWTQIDFVKDIASKP